MRRWDVDQDLLFILAPEDSLYDPKHAIPMATYAEITAFDEPQLLFTLFEQGDLDFKLVSEATQIIEELDQGRLIDQLLLLNQQERLLVADFKQRIKNQWTQDLGILTLKDSTFWIKNEAIFKIIIIYDTISVSGLPYGTHSVPSLRPIKMNLPSILPAWITLIMGLWKSGILFIGGTDNST